MAERVTPEDRIVLIEIGGNDLLTGVPSKEFGQGLDAMIARIAAPGRTVVMFELPLFPHKIAYGQIQRRLAAKYGISLIPKRYFISVIGGANATLDGLHLSDAGAHRMAALVAHILSPVLKARPEATSHLCVRESTSSIWFAQSLRPSIKSMVCCPQSKAASRFLPNAS